MPAPSADDEAARTYLTSDVRMRTPETEGPTEIGFQVVSPDGSVWPATQLRYPDAWAYADLRSLIDDLERVCGYCQLFGAHGPDDDLIREALIESIVTSYGRCFQKGVSARGKGQRRLVPAAIMEELSPEHRSTHEIVVRLRNKHVGHRVDGDMEVSTVWAVRHPTEDSVGVIVLAARVQRTQMHDVQALAEHLLSRLRPLEETEKLALTERAKSDLRPS